MLDRFIVAGCTPWALEAFKLLKISGDWSFVSSPEELEKSLEFNPKSIFFLHWSYIVPKAITEKYECICFHMTDLPFGRGGSPLQNLISRGFKETKLTAFRMNSGLDSGPVYLKETLPLDGNAVDIYNRAMVIASHMIKRIIYENIKPVKQVGKPVVFKRRTPEQSLVSVGSIEQLYDHIRMLDAPGYPKAYVIGQGFLFEFSEAKLLKSRIEAKVDITHV